MSRKKPDTVSGVIVINKHAGVTSFGIVAAMRRLFDTSRVGHTGTLDPMATGVLPILIGRAVKASDYCMAHDKRYTATMRLGIETDTEDTTGNVIRTADTLPSADDVIRCAERFVGEISQIPPMYSAIKIGGQKLVDIARRGETIERESRTVTVSELSVTPISPDTYRLDVACSKGTYIRTLCADIGRALGCGGAMASLVRTASGSFTLDGALTVEEIEKLPFEERLRLPRPVEELFSEYPEIGLSPFFANLYLSGTPLYQDRVGAHLEADCLVRLKCGSLFLGLGRAGVRDGVPVILSEKLFYLGRIPNEQ